MTRKMIRTIGYLALAFVFCGSAALADSNFTIENPPVDFEVIDAEPFDGVGDNGPYPTFNDAVLGTEGEARSMAEFDISTFSVPPGEVISAATFEIRITDVGVFGLGVDGEIPDNLSVDGYVGNGVAELSDFQVADGNLLDVIATPDPWVGQVISFDVTSFVIDLVEAEEPFAGLTIRAGSFGGLMMAEGAAFPKLTIETIIEPSAIEPIDPPATLLAGRNAPNPFTVFTRIEYDIPGESGRPLILTIHDVTGRLVRMLQNVSQRPGTYSVCWDGTNQSGEAVSGGVYFYSLNWNGKSETRRMLLVR